MTMKSTSRNVDGTAGLIGSAVVAAAASGGLQNSRQYLNEDLANYVHGNNAWNAIFTFHLWLTLGWVIIAGIPAAIIYALGEGLLPDILAETAWMYVPILVFVVPAGYAIMGVILFSDHMTAKVRARVWEPLTPEWNSARTTSTGGIFLPIEVLFRMAFYVCIYLPMFILQDAFELLRTVTTFGKHSFRTSKGHYFEKQKRKYLEILKTQGFNAAEQFLIDSSMKMHLAKNARKPSLTLWLRGGYRNAIFAPLERKYGSILPAQNEGGNGTGKSRRAPTKTKIHTDTQSFKTQPVTTNRHAGRTVRQDAKNIKVKPIKF